MRVPTPGVLLRAAREARNGAPDSVLIDEALAALVALNRAAEVDASYQAYDAEPVTIKDEWGDLASFREAASSS